MRIDDRPPARWWGVAASRRAPTCGLSFSDNDPGHSKTSAVEQKLDGGKAKDKRATVGDRRQDMASC